MMRMFSSRRFPSAGLLLAALLIVPPRPGHPTHRPASPIEPRLLAGLVWRNIGPFRGGRISAVTGVIGQPGVFYAGLPLGGVWKTTSAGTTWFPIMDGVKEISSIGALEVAPSDPNVIYAGTGDLITGGGINEGNGMYKSTDAGKTWQHLGLDDTKQIPSILVDPRDPNTVLIAAQGNVHTHTDMRGVFRSTDGGRTWTKTLSVNNETGVQKLAWAYDRPNVILATTVRHYNAPGVPPARGGGAGAPAGPNGTALYLSTDQGVTWKELTGGGLPPLSGRTSVAIAGNTNAQRFFLIGGFGLYRSDDGGAAWRHVAANDRRISGSSYICDVYVDPKNPDLVYTMATSSYKSTDGGNTFTGFKGAPGGDDPHVLWIDPTDGQRMFMGVDQGATISFDGGRTWSTWYNQPTEQVYHISTDNSFPYWVLASQQDAGSIDTRSRGNFGNIGPFDWRANPGYEFGSVAADPLNPNIVYSGGPGGGIVKITYPSGQWINVSPNLDATLGLRKVGNQLILYSPNNPRELMAAFQYLMATTDGGMRWKKLSPDLSLPKGQPAALAGGASGERAAPASTGAIEAFSPSTVAPGTIWAGTNTGLIKLTRDHGATWQDVSIPDLPNASHADVSTIDASHQDAGAAYVAIDYHVVGDYAPYVYRTHDYGKTWVKIVDGLATGEPSGSFTRVVRADTKRAGLLFAGTESAMYVSFDDGDRWQSLMLNLPNTSYRDIVVHDNDLVVGTYGRSIYILDDISPLRQLTPNVAAEPAHLFKPGDAVRVRRDVNGDTPFPPEVPHAANPPLGAIIYYALGSRPSADITLDVLDAAGKTVRHMSSAPIPRSNEPPLSVPDYWLGRPMPLPTETGTNRTNWDIRYDSPPAFSHGTPMGAVEGDTPLTPEGPLALPGTYTVKLTVDGKTYSQTVAVKNDPRSPATAADLLTQHQLQMKLYHGAKEAWDADQQAIAVHERLAAMAGANVPAPVMQAGTAFAMKLAAVAGNPNGGRRGGGGGGGGAGGPPPPPTFVAVNATMNRLLTTLDVADMAPNEPQRSASLTACRELAAALGIWRALETKDLPALNALLRENNLQPVAAAPAPPPPVCTP